MAQNFKIRWLCLMCALIIFGGMMACSSRGALYALIIALCLFILINFKVTNQQWRITASLIIGCLVLFFLSALGDVAPVTMFNRMTDFSDGAMNSITTNRYKLWEATWDMIQVHGALGTGIGTYFLYFPEFRLAGDRIGGTYAHSDPLQFWVELGFAGFVLFYGVCIAVLLRTIRAVRATQNLQEKLYVLTPFFALMACLVHTHVTFNFYNLSIMFVSGLALSLWFFATQNILKTSFKIIQFSKNYSKLSRYIALALPFIMIGSLFSAYVLGEHYNNHAKDHLFAGELEEFASDVILAQKVGFHGNYRPYLLAVNVPMGLLEEESEELTQQQREELTRHAYGYISHVTHINPRSSSALFYMGYIQEIGMASALPKDIQPSEYYYRQALTLDPLHIGARINLSKIYLNDETPQKALETLEEGKHYRYNTPKVLDLYRALFELYLKNKDHENQKDILDKIDKFKARLDILREDQEKTLNIFGR